MSYENEGGAVTDVTLSWYELRDIREALQMLREHNREQSHSSGMANVAKFHKAEALRLRKLDSRLRDFIQFDAKWREE